MLGDLFQPMHLLLILVIVLVVFGPGKLPEVGTSLGEAIRGFRKAMKEVEGPPKDPEQNSSSEQKS